MAPEHLIGLVSDTHGQFRDEVTSALSGVSLILHAGDVGGARVLRALRDIAPVGPCSEMSTIQRTRNCEPRVELTVGGLTVHVSHGHELGSPTPEGMLRAYPADILVFGHTHRALVERSEHRLVVNPGAAGPRRFNLRPSVARLSIANGIAAAEIVWLS